jgi:hypothetical protein
METTIEVGSDTFRVFSSKEVTVMRQMHIMDELKSEPAWAFLYAAFFIGIVVFALLSGGFMG